MEELSQGTQEEAVLPVQRCVGEPGTPPGDDQRSVDSAASVRCTGP